MRSNMRKEEIDFLKSINDEKLSVEVVTDNFEQEELVRITNGPFAGYSGRLVKSYGSGRIAVRIEEIGYSIVFSVSSDEIKNY